MTIDHLDLDLLSRVTPTELAGLINQRAEAMTQETYDAAWQRDNAYIAAIDGALRDAVDGHEAEPAVAPSWLQGLANREVRAASTAFWSRDRFARVRLLERFGLVSLEADDTYVLAMVSALGSDKPGRLRSDPELVARALWRVFEVEGGGEVSLTNVDRFGGGEWRLVFLEFTADGTLDRSRVLAECLRALGRDFAAYRAGWFAATFLALDPTVEECSQLQADLRRLLSSAIPSTVAFALKQLVRVQKVGGLDVEAMLAALPPATTVKPKGTALAALRLARLAGTDHPAAVARIATTALGHPHSDVQRAAGEILSGQGERASVVEVVDDLAPSVRQDLGLSSPPVSPVHVAPVQHLAGVPRPVTPRDLAERAAALLEDCSDAFELEAVLAALATPGTEAALDPLRKRARSVVARGVGSLYGDEWLQGQVARLVLMLVGEPVPAATPATTAARFVARRVEELRASPAPLLATPDLAGGWVSPAALVERLARTPEPRHHDMVAALLRLHPEDRELLEAEDLPPAVRYAVDGVAPRKRLFGGTPAGPEAWWVAAKRSRAPYAQSETPHINGEIRSHTWHEGGRDRTFRYAEFSITTPHAGPAPDDQPTERPDRDDGLGNDFGDWIPTLACVWPHDAEQFLALTSQRVLAGTSWTEVAPDVPRVIDALARHPGRMGDLAAHVVAAGISAMRRDHRLHAVDAFLDLVPTGRVPAGAVATVLARYAEAWPAVRWAESLTAASQGPGGAAAAVELLRTLLPQLPTNHRGLNKLLDVLRDETLRHGWRVDDPVLRQWLGLFGGSSAAATTARLLLR
ncbi:MAG: hypothetical protein HGA44_08155 [Cellulomonadaceae bacterium]|nr:hypothetical protein [Cellulomonadaceae bacterium]